MKYVAVTVILSEHEYRKLWRSLGAPMTAPGTMQAAIRQKLGLQHTPTNLRKAKSEQIVTEAQHVAELPGGR